MALSALATFALFVLTMCPCSLAQQSSLIPRSRSSRKKEVSSRACARNVSR